MAASDAGTSASGQSASDFATTVRSKLYVDKTSMIKDIFEATSISSFYDSRIMITAPPRSGKSTNLEMIKRFFEVEVDESGNQKPVEETINDKLFNDYNLEIWKDIGFCKEHFGKYPVVHIDFKPLGNVEDSAKMRHTFKLIVENTLSEHSYILENSLTENDSLIDPFSGINKLANKLVSLCERLHARFGRKVFVLIDNYDAFLNSSLFTNEIQRKIMMSLVKSSIGSLLNNIDYVGRLLITGVIPLYDEGLPTTYLEIRYCHFLGNHRFTKYYGLTSKEVKTVLCNVVESNGERNEVRKTINNYCNAYGTLNPEVPRVYSMSVLQYVSTRMVQSRRFEQQGFIIELKKCFKIESIRQMLEELLLGNELELNASEWKWIDQVLNVSRMIENGTADAKEVNLCFNLFYHFGYLSVIENLRTEAVIVNIPNETIKYELATDVFDKYKESVDNKKLTDILLVLDKFHLAATNVDEHFQSFCEILNNLVISKDNLKCRNILECLYTTLIARAANSGDIKCKLRSDGPITAVLLSNQHQVAFCVACGEKHSAKRTHRKVVGNVGIFDNSGYVRNMVIIAIGSDWTIVYSNNFRGADIQEVINLP